MSTPRIKALSPPYADGVQQDFDHIMPPGIPPLKLFRTVGINPRVLSRMIAGGLLDKGSISVRARETMILRTCALCGAEYEWGVHVAAFGTKAGFTPTQVAATVHANTQAWPSQDDVLIRLADALHATSSVDDTLWAELKTFYTDEQLIELVMLAGLYHAVSYMVNTTRLELETGAPRFDTYANNSH
jgi:alkylhydroperoxidase family enzyme